MRLDDEQIERYSRQLILAEVGPRGQERLGAARVAVVGTDLAAERVVGYLAAAGVGWIAADPALHGAVDAAQPDVRIVPLANAAADTSATRGDEAVASHLDAVVVSAATVEEATAALATWQERAEAACWIAGAYAGGTPPCPRCAAAAEGSIADATRELGEIRAVLLGTVVATEVVKAILGIGVPLAGGALAYDPEHATVTSVDVTPRPDCPCQTEPRAR